MFSHPSDLCIITVRASLGGGLKTAGLMGGQGQVLRPVSEGGAERSSLRCEPTVVRTVFSGANGCFCR